MVAEPYGLIERLQTFENIILEMVVRWIAKRRGVAFLYWCNVPEWETYLRDNPEYDPSNAPPNAGAGG